MALTCQNHSWPAATFNVFIIHLERLLPNLQMYPAETIGSSGSMFLKMYILWRKSGQLQKEFAMKGILHFCSILTFREIFFKIFSWSFPSWRRGPGCRWPTSCPTRPSAQTWPGLPPCRGFRPGPRTAGVRSHRWLTRVWNDSCHFCCKILLRKSCNLLMFC